MIFWLRFWASLAAPRMFPSLRTALLMSLIFSISKERKGICSFLQSSARDPCFPWVMMRSGLKAVMRSLLGLMNPPMLVFSFASGGKIVKWLTPTTLSPRPRENTISVTLGEAQMILLYSEGAGIFVRLCAYKSGQMRKIRDKQVKE